MNPKFAEISLAIGGSHYPSINPELQQRFGEAVVKRVVERIERECEEADAQGELYALAALQALALGILDDFDMELEDDTF